MLLVVLQIYIEIDIKCKTDRSQSLSRSVKKKNCVITNVSGHHCHILEIRQVSVCFAAHLQYDSNDSSSQPQEEEGTSS